MSVVFRGTATCCSPTPGPSPATVRGVFRGAIRAGEAGFFLGGGTRGRHRRCQPRAMVASPFRAASCGCRWPAGSTFEDGGCGGLSAGWSSAPRRVTQLGVRRFRRLPMRSVRPSIQAAALPHNSISAEHGSSTRPRPIGATDRRTTARAESFVCGSVPVWATLGCRPANGQRQLAGERVPGAIRLRMPDLPRFSAILLRRDRRPASRSTRGCAGDASTIWLTPNVRLADGSCCCSAHGQRQLASERVPSAIRLRTPDFTAFFCDSASP